MRPAHERDKRYGGLSCPFPDKAEAIKVEPKRQETPSLRLTTPEGINQELMPVMRMTVPPSFRGITFKELQPPTQLGRSWLLLFGLLPVEYDDLSIAEIEPGRRFLEVSSMCSIHQWQHERTVLPKGSNCEVSDHISFELRRPLLFLPGMNWVVGVVLQALFRHRHRRLAAFFAAVSHTQLHTWLRFGCDFT